MKFFSALLALATTLSFGQGYTPTALQAESNLRALGEVGNDNPVMVFNNRYEGVRGTPFLQNEWQPTEIILPKGDTIATKTKLNLYTKDVWAILSKGDSVIVEKGIIKEFTYFDSSMNQLRRFVFLTDLELAYYEVLYPGKNITLLCKRTKELTKAELSASYTHGNTYDEFRDGKTKYFIRQKNKLTPLTQKNSPLIKVLGPEAKSILESDKLDVKSESDLIKLVSEVDDSEW
jgi:hypothetical protein